MFGEEFGDCWHEIPGVSGLELSGDLRFRGPRVLRKLRHDCNGRPYVQARKVVNHESDGRVREGRVMLHRAVMSVVLGRQLGRDEFVCHRDDDRRNNWPQNLYIGDYHSNAADSLRNGGRVRGEQHPFAKLSDEQVREIRRALARGSGVVTLPEPVGCIGARSAGSSTACVASRASHAKHDSNLVGKDPPLRRLPGRTKPLRGGKDPGLVHKLSASATRSIDSDFAPCLYQRDAPCYSSAWLRLAAASVRFFTSRLPGTLPRTRPLPIYSIYIKAKAVPVAASSSEIASARPTGPEFRPRSFTALRIQHSSKDAPGLYNILILTYISGPVEDSTRRSPR